MAASAAIAAPPAASSNASPEPVAETPSRTLADLLPPPGCWTVEQYLLLFDAGGVEYVDGHLELLPVPTNEHQRIVQRLNLLLCALVDADFVMLGPSRFRVADGRMREPDLFVLPPDAAVEATGPDEARYCTAAVLCIEVLSEGREASDRDLRDKPADYAAAGVAEYWVVVPAEKAIRLFRLGDDGSYGDAEMVSGDETAISQAVPGLSVNVAALFAAAASRGELPPDEATGKTPD